MTEDVKRPKALIFKAFGRSYVQMIFAAALCFNQKCFAWPKQVEGRFGRPSAPAASALLFVRRGTRFLFEYDLRFVIRE